MNYRSLSDLDRTIRNNIYKIPYDIDLVIGVPRSGIIPATTIALLLDKPFTELSGARLGHVISHGRTRPGPDIKAISEYNKLLIVDDSVNTGKSILEARCLLRELFPDKEVVFLAVYGGGGNDQTADIVLEPCPAPRIFQWNLISHERLATTCFDLDGVLCRDPTPEENDDGLRYIEFIKNVEPVFLPKRKIRRIVTARLQKYRDYTEAWLRNHGVEYHHLDMIDAKSAEERRRLNLHVKHKSNVYYQDSGSELFVESDTRQALSIVRFSGKPVLDFAQQQLHLPDSINVAKITINGKKRFKRARDRIYEMIAG